MRDSGQEGRLFELRGRCLPPLRSREFALTLASVEMMTNHIPVDLQRVKSRFCLICGSDFSSANLRGARRSENSLRKVQLRDDRESCRCEKFAPTFDDESLKVVQSLKNVEDLGAADHERRRQRVS
jgi:uncharacterized protein YjbI with pentapeptide repeats